MPPSGVRLSCMLLTAPQDASVVTVVNSAEFAMPKRTSLPSILPPAWRALGAVIDAQRGEGRIVLAPSAQ